ncbi:hypothetical protein ACTFIR_000395 [Dictyostelium discoideum]
MEGMVINNNNNNNIISFEDEFNQLKLKNKKGELSIKKLQKVTNDIGLLLSEDVNELYNGIEQYYNIKIKLEKESKQQQTVLNNNNNNNKNEILFWKVFRNIYIFKYIFSNFKYSNYKKLNLIDIIIRDYENCIEIIKDKVKSNSSLYFGYNRELDYFFENVKEETEENQLFLNQFINNYCISSKLVGKIFNSIIESSNLMALISFINIYKSNARFKYQGISKERNLFKEFKLGELINFLKKFVKTEYIMTNTQYKIRLKLKKIKDFQFSDLELNENLFMLLKPLINWDTKNKNITESKYTIDKRDVVLKYIDIFLKIGSIQVKNKVMKK